MARRARELHISGTMVKTSVDLLHNDPTKLEEVAFLEMTMDDELAAELQQLAWSFGFQWALSTHMSDYTSSFRSFFGFRQCFAPTVEKFKLAKFWARKEKRITRAQVTKEEIANLNKRRSTFEKFTSWRDNSQDSNGGESNKARTTQSRIFHASDKRDP